MAGCTVNLSHTIAIETGAGCIYDSYYGTRGFDAYSARLEVRKRVSHQRRLFPKVLYAMLTLIIFPLSSNAPPLPSLFPFPPPTLHQVLLNDQISQP